MSSTGTSKYVLRIIALTYITVLVGVPVGLIFWRTFENGIRPVLDALTDPSVLHAFRVTAIVAFWTVLLNTIFGVGVAILLVRHRFPGRRLLSLLIDLPLAVSPVVVGLALILVYGRFAADRRLARRPRHQGDLRLPRHGAGHHVRLAATRGPGGGAGARGDRDRPGAGGVDAGRQFGADLPAGHAAGDSVGARLRHRA